MAESADSYETPVRPTAAPRPRRGGRPRDKKSLVASSESSRLDTTPDRVTKVLRLGPPSTSVHRSRRPVKTRQPQRRRAAAHPASSSRTYRLLGLQTAGRRDGFEVGFPGVTSELDG